jgi:uncharacterized SAM-binding protein YcdF (DUF218 family)
MFFVLSKVLGFLALPSNFLAMVALAGAVLLATRFARLGRGLLIAGAVLLAIAGWSPLGAMITQPLEDRFPPYRDDGTPVAGIIVLGGALDNMVSGARNDVTLNDAAERMTEAVLLARRHPEARLIFTGGEGALIPIGTTEAAIARRFFADLGLPPERTVFESDSRSTAENASNVKSLIGAKPAGRWLLVTSAWHMPRSIGAFRAVGMDLTAYPVDYRTRGPIDDVLPSAWVSQGLSRVDMASREWIGLVTYYLTGRSAELLPSP